MDLTGKVALVTGGARGIGRATAESLLRAGARVFIVARREESLREALTALRDMGEAAGAVCDARDAEAVQAMFETCRRVFGGVDILVNNAGIGLFGQTVEETSPADFRAVIETNLCGVFYCCHAAIPQMKERGGGYIVNISSLAGANAHPRMAAYNASKFGLNGFSEALMQEVRQDNIKVSYILPGSVNTEFGGDTPDDSKAWQLQPEDVAQAVMDLLRHNPRSLPSRVELRPSRPPVRK
jgi:NAD(P)-dependent dehydrogenase (short-subunit alcohol dehydrogenase family)